MPTPHTLTLEETLTETYTGESQIDSSTRIIELDYSQDTFSGVSKGYLKDKNCFLEGEDIHKAFGRVCCAFSDDSEHAQRLYEYVSKGWFKFPTPVLANGGTEKGLPINCYLSQIGDSMGSIAEHYAENMFLAVRGGGIGTDMSLLRSKGTKTSKGNYTPGVIPFCRVIDSQVLASIQGSTRRGAAALYLHVSHPEIEEFVEIRKHSGDANRRSRNIHNGVIITDAFMEAVEGGHPWRLIDPHTEETVKIVGARDLWMKILSTRVATGEPFLFFKDTANKSLNEALKKKGFEVNISNLCTEIMLPTSPDRTAVCCLSSVNLEFFDQWCNSEDFIEDLMRMLDNILEVFILNADPHMHRAIESAKKERSVGLGAMGFHTLLQQKGIPWESAMASVWNRKVFKHIQEKVEEANLLLGYERGSPEDIEGTNMRFAHTMAIAPNGSVTITHNVSPSIEPLAANAFTHKTNTGVYLIKNKILENTFRDKYQLGQKELDIVWKSVILNDGSVQHLNELPNGRTFEDVDKELFKTAMEIDQYWIIDHAATRQPFIDQGQSVNLFIPPKVTKAYLHDLHKTAWKKGLKALYYCRSKSVGKTGVYTEDTQKTLERNSSNECLSCEG